MTFKNSTVPLASIYATYADIDPIIGNTLWTWGLNNNGQLGDNTNVSKSSPVQTVAAGTNWVGVGGGFYHSAAIKTDGTLWLWGENTYGTLGDNASGSFAHKSSPVQTVASGTYWKSVDGSQFHTAAIKTDGTLWTWGYNGNGQLGDNTTVNKSSPIQTVAGGTNWKSVACGDHSTAAIKTDGTLWTWGLNNYGQLGDNTTTYSRSSPVQTVAGGANWKSVACGQAHAVAIKTDGTLWTWGYNGYGQLGDNTTVNKSSPVQTVAGGTNWKSVACHGLYAAAIKTDGTLWTWGYNGTGQLGNNSTTNTSSPAQTVAGGTNWRTVSCGGGHAAAIKTDGTLWTWGSNSLGELGDNTNALSRLSPVQTVAGGTNWKSVACGQTHTMAVTFTDLQ